MKKQQTYDQKIGKTVLGYKNHKILPIRIIPLKQIPQINKQMSQVILGKKNNRIIPFEQILKIAVDRRIVLDQNRIFPITQIQKEKKAVRRIHQMDDRKIPPKQPVYKTIGFVSAISNKERGQRVRGTGFLISSQLALTAAHNIFSKQEGKYHSQIYFTPPSDQQKYQSDSKHYQVYSVYFPQEYKTQQDEPQAVDFAILVLNCEQNELQKYGALQITTKINNQDLQLQVCGYADKNNQTLLLTDSGKILKKQDKLIFYRIDTMRGASGAPILLEKEKKCVGIHNFGAKDGNIGTRLTKKNIKEINKQLQLLSRFEQENKKPQGFKMQILPVNKKRVDTVNLSEYLKKHLQ